VEDISFAGSATMAMAMLAASYIMWRVTQRTDAGTLRRNNIAGIRTKATLTSDDAWATGHKAAAPALRVAAGISGLTGIGLLLTTSRGDLTILVLIVGIALLLGAMAKAVIFANKAAKDS
jgi:hypothetical protein